MRVRGREWNQGVYQLCVCDQGKAEKAYPQGGYLLVQRASSFIQGASLKVPHVPSLGQGPRGGRDKQSETWASDQETWAINSSHPGWLCDPG